MGSAEGHNTPPQAQSASLDYKNILNESMLQNSMQAPTGFSHDENDEPLWNS